MQAAGRLLASGIGTEFLKEMILVAKSNGLEGQLCKVPKLTGRTQPWHKRVIRKVTGIMRGQREEQNSWSSNHAIFLI